jgi:hypothetical protein
MGNLTLLPLVTRAASVNSQSIGVRPWRVAVQFDVTELATAVDDTLDVYIDFTLDGAIWINAVHLNQVVGTDSPGTQIAILDPTNPGTAVFDVTSDCAAGVTRPAIFGAFIRARSVIVEGAVPAKAEFKFSVSALVIE